jgi:uncharacterized membrane protein/protein-disulfide isomerase
LENLELTSFRNYEHHQQLWPWWRILLMGLNILALMLTVVLSWHYLAGISLLGCGGGTCEQVLSSKWSMILGIVPISGLAIGVYLALLVSGMYIKSSTEISMRRMAWGTMLILVGAITGSAIWYTIVQKMFIGKFCPYCIATHTTGLLLTVLIVWRATREVNNNANDMLLANQQKENKVALSSSPHLFSPWSITIRIIIGLVLSVIVAVSQIKYTPAAIFVSGDSNNSLPDLNYAQVPIVGESDAPYIVTLLFDYQCPHCQKIHFMLNEAIRQYKGKLAFVLCPTPLNTECNPYIPKDVEAFKNSCELAKIGMALWLANRKAFPAFENWMFSFETGNTWQPRSFESCRTKAIELVGEDKLNKASSDPWIGQYLQTCVQIYGRTLQNGKGGVPKLICGSRWVIPELNNTAELVTILQKTFGVAAP